MSLSTFKKVAVLLGGTSAEREVSLRSGTAVLNALKTSGVNAFAFDPADRQLSELQEEQVSHAIIMMHGRGGEDGAVQGALQYLGIPYSGSQVLGSALAMDKIRSKQVFEAHDLPTAKYRSVTPEELEKIDPVALLREFNGQLMVKPSLEGSSIGMTRVSEASQLLPALQTAFEFDGKVLLETFIDGREFTVAVLNGRALPSISMETPRTFYDYEAKYHNNTTEYHCPSGLDNKTEEHLGALALAAFESVGATGWGRVDFMQDKEGSFFILEVNTVPGMTEKSLMPMAAKEGGLSFEQLVMEILATCES